MSQSGDGAWQHGWIHDLHFEDLLLIVRGEHGMEEVKGVLVGL